MQRNPPLKTLTLTLNRSLHSRPKSHEPYDPPFSPIPETPKSRNPNPTKTPPPAKSKPTPLRSDLPFDFRYSYSESVPNVKPIGFREPPRFSPFGPDRLDREWNGVSAKFKEGGEIDGVLRGREDVLGEPLTEEEVEELVEKYRHSDCCRQINLARNGVYLNVVERVREAFETSEVVRLDCTHVGTSDCKKIGVKLRDLVPCVPLLFKDDQIIIWRGKESDTSQCSPSADDTGFSE